MIFSKNPKRALIFVVGALALLAFAVSIAYYNNDNKSVDPRVVDARELYSNYDAYAQANDFNAVFSLLDSIEDVYRAIDHYKNSFETGVLYNNRAAAYLSMALYHESQSLSLDGLSTLSTDTLLFLSEKEALNSITIYTRWLDSFKGKTEEELRGAIEDEFLEGLASYELKQKERFLKKRVSELVDAQIETPRRLSVAYTNLGIVKRHQDKYEEAIKHYSTAVELWDRNLAAENNINVLLGKPLKKQNVLEKLFPPDKSN